MRKALAYIVNLVLLDTGILENLLDGLHCLSEKIHVEFLKLGSGQGLPHQLKSSSDL
jgi:hypothetical protein